MNEDCSRNESCTRTKYAYDLAGRRTSVGGSLAAVNLPNAISTTAYNADNQLTQWGTATPTYDANGNTLSDGTNTYVWNARNQLASMNLTGESFQYDPFGRRVAKTILGTTTNYLYDGANPVQELSGTTPTANMLTGGVDEYFTRTDSTGTADFLTDALGSTIELTDSSGNGLAQYTYEPFGNTTATGSSTNTYQYTGRENDGNGVYFYRNRYYSPTLQRFISEDPSGFGGVVNFYAYALNNPASFIDPAGLDVTVTLYQGNDGNFFGHVGVSVNNGSAWGFDPVWWSFPLTPFNLPVPGTLDNIPPGRPFFDRITIPTTPQQDEQVLRFIKNRYDHPGFYNLAGRNCAQFAEDALRSAGLQVPPDFTPKGLLQDLHRLYGPPYGVINDSPIPQNIFENGSGTYVNF